AEDGIRDRTVTGVQTCALPIFLPLRVLVSRPIKRIICKGKIAVRTTETPDELARVAIDFRAFTRAAAGKQNMAVRVKIERVHVRSEERRVGKESRCGWGAGE